MSKLHIIVAFVTSVSVFSVGQTTQASTLIFEDDFSGELPVAGAFYTTTDLTNWNVTEGNVDVVADGFSGCTQNPCIDLDGTFSGDPAVLQTKKAFSFEAGHEYKFQLDILSLNSGANDPFEVTIGSFLSYSNSDYTAPLLVDETFTPASSSVENIVITMFGPVNNAGPFLTRVSLEKLDGNEPDPDVIPLPATLPLLLSGLAGAGLFARRRQKR